MEEIKLVRKNASHFGVHQKISFMSVSSWFKTENMSLRSLESRNKRKKISVLRNCSFSGPVVKQRNQNIVIFLLSIFK